MEQPFVTFADAPRLTNVRLEASDSDPVHLINSRSLHLAVALPRTQVTALYNFRVFTNIPEARQILSKDPALEHCWLDCIAIRSEGLVSRYGEVQVLPNLKTFQVVFNYKGENPEHIAAQFFRAYSMPVLASLRIAIKTAFQVFDTAAFIQHVYSRFGSPLTHLMLVRVPFEKGRIESIFQHLPFLEHLHTQFAQIAVHNELFPIIRYNEDKAAG